MIKAKKLALAREVIAMLSTKELQGAQGGVVSAPGAACEPSGIRPCPTKAPICG